MSEWAIAGMVALGVLAGLPLYATAAGYAARGFRRMPYFHRFQHEFNSGACPYGEKRGACDCDNWKVWAWIWPLVLGAMAIRLSVRALVFLPARAAYRAAIGQSAEPTP